MSSELPKLVRKFVYDYFAEQCRAPHMEEIMRKFEISKQEATIALDSLQRGRFLYRLQGTQRILMAWPFSNMATPFLVKTESGKSYYANCAWDSIGIHVLLRQPIQIKAYCFHCGDLIELSLSNERVVKKEPADVLVHFSKPAAQWFDDVVDTCGNNMNFFGSEGHLQEWKAENPEKSGHTLTFNQIVEMSRFFYRDRLKVDYGRPTPEQIAAFFSSIGLSGDFWRL
ncbi:MAG: alkylmercury lyase family protein [Thermoplasmata archaeon]